jgi:hypothetical protein
MRHIANNFSNRPLSHTVSKVCELSGFGPTTVWKLIADGRLKAVRVEGIRRTLVTDESLVRLLASAPQPQPRRRGRPRKSSRTEQSCSP